MSAVKNLRAMFEQKGETSPPDRGRPPAISPSESPRPLNKIKTSFIAVEKGGRLGLQRGDSNDSETPTQRAPGALGDITSPFVPSEKFNAVEPTMEKAPVPASPEANCIPAECPKAISGGQSPTDSPRQPRAQNVGFSESAPAELKRLDIDGASGTFTTGVGSKSPEKMKASNGTGAGKDKETDPSKPAGRTVPKTTTSKSNLPPLSTAAANKTATKPAKSPITAQTPKTRSPTTSFSQTPAKSATPKPVVKTTKSSLGSSLNKKPASLAPSPVITGNSKPKAKSPTRPIALPERLTTHTAASGSKLGNARAQSQTRERGPTPASRSSSRVRVPASATSASKTATSNCKRQNSTNSRPRPSLGVPVKQTAKDHPPTKEKEVDEGFLARMMRPTAASASKTAEKVVTSPPRRSSATPGPAGKRSLSKPRTKKPATKPAAPSTATTPKQSRASSVAAKVEQAATAEEVVEVAKTADEVPLSTVIETPQEVAQPVEETAEVTQEVSAPPSEAEAVAALQTPNSDAHDVNEEASAQEAEAAKVANAATADIQEKEEEKKSASTPETPKPTSDS